MRVTRGVILGLGLVLAMLAAAATAQQQTPRQPRPAPAIEISPVDIINAANARTVNVPVGKTRMVRLPVSVRDVVVGDANVADIVVKTPQLIYLVGRAVGNTNAFFLGGDGKEVLRLEIKVEVDVVTLRDTIEALMPNDKIEVKAVNQNIFLTGNVRSPAVSDTARVIARRFVGDDSAVVNLLAIREETQVLLKVKVAEVQRNALKEFGVSLTGTGFLDPAGNANAVGAPATAGIANTRFNQGLYAGSASSAGTSGTTQPPFGLAQFAYIGSNLFRFNSVINALEREGFIRTLAEPNLTAVSGEHANILVGGEFPVPVAQQNNTISIVFKQFGIALAFTPVVLDQNRISLKVATEVSALSSNGAIVLQGIQIPGLSVRRAATTVEMASGGSLMIGGLLQNDINNVVNGYPGLKDIPVLGQLFRSQSFQRNETELVVTVTAFLARPMNEPQIALPTQGYLPASDLDIYLLGRLYGRYASQAEPPQGQLKGPMGYILE
jgi:pilus assembly protein CpaC